MGLEIKYIVGQTPLSEEELEGLKIPSISTRAELDEIEQLNIEKAIEWTLRLKIKQSNYFLKSSYLICIKKCTVMFGNGQEILENQKKTSELKVIK